MKLCLATTLAALILATTLASASEASKTPNSQAAFDRLKSVAGNWEAPGKNGTKTHTSYEVVANGTAVVEHFVDDSMGAANAMVTVYYLDGNRLLLDHYCMAKNRPRMQAKAFDSNTGELRFAFVDAVGLASPNAGHMHDAQFRFVDANHFTTDWQFFEGGKPTFHESVEYTRVQ